ncbi:MAG: hypothetical protein GWP10_11205 [Nitrospiraceae bacterium]|nr:hypothetical protein [Nitrospiraceae bacterium]
MKPQKGMYKKSEVVQYECGKNENELLSKGKYARLIKSEKRKLIIEA